MAPDVRESYPSYSIEFLLGVTLTMAFDKGTRFGPYEIVERIGSGGMGDVYRATDTELKRDVAVKVLPESFADDADRLARFRREAEVLASLNHPNIAHVYGLEKADGRIVIAMELIEGPTLADRIKDGPLPPDEALGIARQVADALEAAHARQIVHRDLKPANVKLRADGTVKVLDFGIAKSVDARAASGGRSPIATPAATETGVILGTAAYMSPEQARGKPVDQRTDIWAFGCLLFEMLTGQPAFGGEDVMLTLARVLDRDTDLSSMPGTLSPVVRHTIKLCLEKDQRRRIADIRDVRLALDGGFESISRAAAAPPRDVPLWRRPLPVALVALVVGGALIGYLLHTLAPAPAERPLLRVRVSVPPDIRFPGFNTGFSLSPDGRHVALTARDREHPTELPRLWIWSLDSFDAKVLPGTEGARRPFWSSDGRMIGFAADGDLKLVSPSGGPVQTLLSAGITDFSGGAWGSTDIIVFANAENGLSAAPAVGGEARVLTRVPADAPVGLHDELPLFLPDGRRFLYLRHDLSVLAMSGIYVGSIDLLPEEQAEMPLVLADDGPRFFARPGSTRGYLLFQRQQTLYAQAFNAEALVLDGEPVPIETGLNPGAGYGLFSPSGDGNLLVYQPESAAELRQLVWVDHSGQEEPLGLEPGRYEEVALSPDGTGIAVTLGEVGLASTVWIWSPNARTLAPLAPGRSFQRWPYWTDDGERIVYGEEGTLVSRRADGAGATEHLFEGFATVTDQTADGTLLVRAPGASGREDRDVVLLPMTGERKTTALLATEYDEGLAALSPDGRWLAYQSNESGSGRVEVYVRPFPDVDTRRWQISTEGGQRPKWAPDGRALYFVGPSQMMRATVEAGPTFSWRPPEPLFAYDISNLGSLVYGLSPDGQRFLLIRPVEATSRETEELIVVHNWLDELERRARTQ
jgi:serine/threonine protein kinase